MDKNVIRRFRPLRNRVLLLKPFSTDTGTGHISNVFMKYSSTIIFENVRTLKTVIIHVYAQGGHTEFEIVRYIHLTSFISIFFSFIGEEGRCELISS